MELTTTIAHLKGLASMTDDLGSKASVHDRLGARPAFMFGWEAESMSSQTIG
jgi:hypothetical protein